MTRHEYGWIHQYYTYDGQPRERVLTDIAEADVAVEKEKRAHRVAGRRQRIQAIDLMFKAIAVRPGTQQHSAMGTVRETARVFAQTIEEKCPEGAEKTEAIHRVLEAMMWANQAISHR